MVLEALLSHRGIEARPIDLFVLSFVSFLISTALVMGIFSGTIESGPVQNPIGAGYLIIAFISIPLVPLFHRLMKTEQERDLSDTKRFEGSFFMRHEQIIMVYTVLFVSIIISSSLVYILIPSELASVLFKDQEKELGIIRGEHSAVTGQVITGDYAQVISGIFQNNLRVLVLAFFFSFVFGAGAIFIIAWNASVVGVLVGQIATSLGDNILYAYIVALPMTLFNIIPHGIFEIGAYFIGGISGGILSAAISSSTLTIRQFKIIFKDVVFLFTLAVFMLVLGSVVEVFL